MQTTQSYIQGQWTQGKGEGRPIFDSITGGTFYKHQRGWFRYS